MVVLTSGRLEPVMNAESASPYSGSTHRSAVDRRGLLLPVTAAGSLRNGLSERSSSLNTDHAADVALGRINAQWLHTTVQTCRCKLYQINLGNFESLVVIVQNGLKVAEHCIKAANAAN